MHPLIADVLQHQSYRKSCYDLVRGTHFDGEDLYQEMLLALLEKEDVKLWEVWHSGGHRWYVLSLIYRLFLGKGSLWDQKYRDRLLRVDVDWTRVEVIAEIYDHENEVQTSKQIEAIEDAIAELHWYERNLFMVYVEAKNMRRISTSTTIPYNSIRLTINTVKDKLKKKLK
jgi:DNA-directed RNA polymerase specialized sigma24 family protein